MAAMFKRRNLTSLAAVPATRAVAFELRWADRQADCNRSQVWVASEHGVHAITGEQDGAHNPTWASDGRRIAFLQDRDGLPQIHCRAADGSGPRCMSRFEFGVVSIQQWCADRGKLLVLAYSENLDPSAPMVSDFLPYKLDGAGYKAAQRVSLYLMDEADGSTVRIVTMGGNVKEARWACDGEKIAYIAERSGAQRHRTDLWVTESVGPDKLLTSSFPSVSDLTWSPDGQSIAFAASARDGDSRMRLEAVRLGDGSRVGLPAMELAAPSCIHWSSDSTALLALQAHRGAQRVTAVGLDGAMHTVLDAPRQILEFACTSADLYWIGVDINQGPRLRRAAHDGSAASLVGNFNRGDETCRQARLRTFLVPDGLGGEERIEGWLLTPGQGGPWPLLVELHGGPHSYVMLDPNTHEHWDPLLAQGWAILALNAVGSSSYGDEFASRIIGRWGELDLPQHLAAVGQLQGEGIASERVACFGHSYGGYLCAWALTQPGPWTAGVMSGAVTNLVSHAGTSDTGYYVGPYAMGRELGEDWEPYRRLSPLAQAANVRAPVLILQGADDQRCPPGQAEEFHAALLRSGQAHSRLVVYPGATHHLSSRGKPSLRLDYYGQLLAWLSGQHEERGARNEERGARNEE